MFNELFTAGIEVLSSWQQKDGSFLSLSSPNPQDFAASQILHTTFSTALILSCMNSMPETVLLKQLKKKSTDFLLSQKSNDWSFNYWIRKSKESDIMPYPDDLDDTFVALSALYEYDSSLFDGTTFAKIIGILTTTEMKEGGPYKTWLLPHDAPDVWKDIDVVVNSNIAYFLSLQDIQLPNVTSLIEKSIHNNIISSPYYNGTIPVLYFISRWYKGKLKAKLIALLRHSQQQSEIADNALYNAFIIISLLNLGVSPKTVSKNIAKLIRQQNKQGWETFGFYIDPVMHGKKHYAGSKALTTAFCLLALAKYANIAEQKSTMYIQDTSSVIKQRIDMSVRSSVLQRFSDIDRTMNLEARQIVDEMLHADVAKQITLFPYLIASNIKRKRKKVTDELLISLGCTSVYGWLAYTIYDNFLDDEGDPKTIPVANVSLRELTVLFLSIMSDHQEFFEVFKKIMDNTDKANLWEVNNCRFRLPKQTLILASLHIPDYGNYKYLADRSMGHALSACAVLFTLGYKKDSPEVKLLLKFFYHYIIARQLNDDAHDFVEDLKKGHINAVGAVVLKTMQQTYSTNVPLKFSHILTVAHEVFWKDVVVDISQDILYHTAKARKAITDNEILSKKEIFLAILTTVESAAERALREHANVMGFLQSYD